MENTLPASSAGSFRKIAPPITLQECAVFPGGWSVKPASMKAALEAVSFGSKLKVLELGAGAGTVALVDLLKAKSVPFEYVSYENDTKYICTRPEVYTIVWSQFPTLIRPGTYDFVIIDGPKGAARAKWYPALRDRVRAGTVILIDDYGHHPEFKEALNEYFNYKIVDEFMPESRSGVTWRVVKVEGVSR